MKKIYVGTLYRFGYDLTAAGSSEKEVKDALMSEYVRAYRNQNGEDPWKEEGPRGESYYDSALEDIVINKLTPGKVEWL